jgi:integrase
VQVRGLNYPVPVDANPTHEADVDFQMLDANLVLRQMADAGTKLNSREYLTPTEVEKLIKAARASRYGHRDATLILIAYRHGLRAVEICDLEWSQVELGRSASLHVRRVKNGKPSVHPLRGDEIRALRELRRQFPDSAFVFATERGGPQSRTKRTRPDQRARNAK